jgi:hypothetical protein
VSWEKDGREAEERFQELLRERGWDGLTVVPSALRHRMRELKGEALAVWLAHLLQAGPDRRVEIKVQQVADLTGYNPDTVRRKRAELAGKGWLAPESAGQPRGHRSRYGVRAFRVVVPVVGPLASRGELGPRERDVVVGYIAVRRGAGARDETIARELTHHGLDATLDREQVGSLMADPGAQAAPAPEGERRRLEETIALARKGVRKKGGG